MKRLEAKYAPLHLVPLIERLGTPQVRDKRLFRGYNGSGIVMSLSMGSEICDTKLQVACIYMAIFLTANCYSTRGRPADKGEAVLRVVDVRGHPHAHPQLSAGQRVARPTTQQRCHARGRVHGVPPALECHAICLLHPSGHTRVHCRVCHLN